MPLTPEEQRELDELEAKFGKSSNDDDAAAGGLTPEEQAELETLEATVKPKIPARAKPQDGALTRIAKGAGALAMGVGNSYGIAPHLAAGLSTATGQLTGDPRPAAEHYKELLEKYRQTQNKARQWNPTMYDAGDLGYGALLAAAAAPAGVFTSAAGTAAIEGAAKSRETGMGVVQDAGLNAGIGTLGAGVFKLLGGAARSIGPAALRETAEEQAVKATTGNSSRAVARASGMSSSGGGDPDLFQRKIREGGRAILDERTVGPDGLPQRVLGFGENVEEFGPKIAAAKRQYGEKLGEVTKAMDEHAPFEVNRQAVADDLADYATQIPETKAGLALQERILEEGANFSKQPRSFASTHAFKQQFKHKNDPADAFISNQDVTNKIRGIFGKEQERAAERLAAKGVEGAEIVSQYRDLKPKYAAFKTAADNATEYLARNKKNRMVSPSDYGVGAVGALSDPTGTTQVQALKGMLAAAGNNTLRTRGNSAIAVAADTIADKLDSSPELVKKYANVLIKAAERGPAAMVVTHEILMKRHPEYREQFLKEDDK